MNKNNDITDERLKKIHIGCSGYYYKHWVGLFYPDTCKSSDFFGYYQQNFSTVEINSTFYHFPTDKQINSWLKKSRDDFLFTFKAPRLITHRKRLVNCKDSLLLFLHLVKIVKQSEKLGVILFQTPGSLTFNLDTVERFLYDLPTGYKYAFEFRNREYYNNEIYNLLAQKGIDFVYVSESQGPPFEDVIGDFKYFRLHGSGSQYSSNYTEEELHNLAGKIIHSIKRGSNDIYVYFNNDYNAYAAYNAIELMKILNISSISPYDY